MTSTDRRYGLIGNTAIKVPCRACSTSNITLSGEQTIDGVAVVTDDRVLVTAQTSSVDNGIYVADTGAWVRATDLDGSYDIVTGALVKVNSGTSNSGFWYVTTTGAPVIGTDAVNFGMASSTLAVISAFMQTMLDDANAAAARTTIGAAASGANSDVTSMTGLTVATVAANPVRATDLQAQTLTAYTTGGVATAYTLTPNPAISALAENQEFDVEFHASAGATPTLAISGLTAKSLKYRDSTGAKAAVTSTQVPSGWRSRVTYDGTDYIVREVPAAVAVGGVVQIVRAELTSSSTGTTDMFFDDTIPQNTEGDEYLTCAITPVYASSKLLVEATLWGGEESNTSTVALVAALFRDTTAGAICATAQGSVFTEAGVNIEAGPMHMSAWVDASATTATTFKLRAGLAGAGAAATFRINGAGGGGKFSTAMVTSITITEIKQ